MCKICFLMPHPGSARLCVPLSGKARETEVLQRPLGQDSEPWWAACASSRGCSTAVLHLDSAGRVSLRVVCLAFCCCVLKGELDCSSDLTFSSQEGCALRAPEGRRRGQEG